MGGTTTTKTQLTGIAVGRASLVCDPANPTALQSNPAPHTAIRRSYGATGETIITTSPLGRVMTTTLDAGGNVASMQVGTLTPINLTRFASGEFRGKLKKRAQGLRELT